MFQKYLTEWRELMDDKPGTRFRARYERKRKARKGLVGRAGWIVVAVILVLGGIVLLPAPGPGVLVIAAGGALLAQESAVVAGFMDRAELSARRLVARWRRHR